MLARREDGAVAIALLALGAACFGLPRLLLWRDPVGDTAARWAWDVGDAQRWVSERGAPLPTIPGTDRLQAESSELPEPHAVRELHAADPDLTREERSAFQDLPRLGTPVADPATLHQVAYLSDPAVPRDRWGRRWVLYRLQARLRTGAWWSEWPGVVCSLGEDGEVDWGRGDDIPVRGGWVPRRSWGPLFLLLASPLLLVHLARRARALVPAHELARDALLSLLSVTPVWGVLLLIHFGEPRLERKLPFLEPLEGLLWVTPTTALLATCGGLAWLGLFWRRVVRAARMEAAREADPPLPPAPGTWPQAPDR